MQQLILELAPRPAPTFDNFHPGGNGMVIAALRESAAGGERFIYVWGEPGSGKTHLLRAWVEALQRRGRGASYLCPPAFDPPANALELALDDVDLLDGAGQLAAFDLHNAVRQSGGRLLAAGQRPPADLPLREDLRTRIASGIVVQLHPLGDAEKREALRRHSTQRDLRLGEEIFDYLLTRYARDMGTQMAVIDALDRLSLQTRRPATLALLREALKGRGEA
jgi:DnaA family protein